MDKKAVHLLQNGLTTVKAVFPNHLTLNQMLDGEKVFSSGYAYTFKADKDLDLKAGDFVLAHANDEVKIVQISEVHDEAQIDADAAFEYKWIIQKIDLAGYRKRLDEERAIGEMLARLQQFETKKRLLERIREAGRFDDVLKKMAGRLGL